MPSGAKRQERHNTGKLANFFPAKFPLIHKRCFEFVNVHKNTVKDYTVWLQAMDRQGRLYCWLIIPSKDLSKLDDAEETYEDIVLLNELEEDPVPPSIPEIRRSISPSSKYSD